MASLFQVGSSFYEEYIVKSHSHCQKSIVSLRFYRKDDAHKKLIFNQTGIIFASGKTSCCILTSHLVRRKNDICEVHFSDGTKKEVIKEDIKVLQNFRIGTIYVRDVDMDKVKIVAFSDNEIAISKMVFTCGYNTTMIERSFFSGSIVSGVGIQNDTSKDSQIFVHGCSVGSKGYMGSAVFDERQLLVGMNIACTMAQGEDYAPKDGKGFGGTISALNLQSINLGLTALYKCQKGKSIKEVVQYINDSVLEFEASFLHSKAVKEGGTSKALAVG